MKNFKVYLILFALILFSGCPLFNFLNFNGYYKIGDKDYKSINFFNEGLFLNESYCEKNALYRELVISENGESCTKIFHPIFDLYKVSSPKNEVWDTVTVCNSNEYDSFIAYYYNPGNNKYFVGKLENESNYINQCDSFYQISEDKISTDSSYFDNLVRFCKEYEADIFSSNSKIKKNAQCFFASEIKGSPFVKIFRISKDEYFYSNGKESFLLHNGKLYLFCMQEDNKYYFMPLSSELNDFFGPIVNNCLSEQTSIDD